MVPQWAPGPALHMFQSFLNNTSYWCCWIALATCEVVFSGKYNFFAYKWWVINFLVFQCCLNKCHIVFLIFYPFTHKCHRLVHLFGIEWKTSWNMCCLTWICFFKKGNLNQIVLNRTEGKNIFILELISLSSILLSAGVTGGNTRLRVDGNRKFKLFFVGRKMSFLHSALEQTKQTGFQCYKVYCPKAVPAY